MLRFGRARTLWIAGLALLLGCLPAGSAPSPVQLGPGSPAIALEQITDQLERPVYLTHAGDGSGRLFVVEKKGRVMILRGGVLDPTPFLDLTELVASEADEQGLLSIAFHPSYPSNGLFYLAYSDRQHSLEIVRYRLATGSPEAVDLGSRETLLNIEHPGKNKAELRHYGGLLRFGPDGYLYVSVGDQGSNGPQNRLDLRGKLLRLDVDGGAPYVIPPDNPFVGEQSARPEVWAYGLRNPWRFSFDRQTGDLYLADVGRSKWEEINLQRAGSPSGQNYGWNVMEGRHCREASREAGGPDCETAGFELPIVQYDHSRGCAVIGGHVYRGPTFPQLSGLYFYADYCSGRIWALQEQAPGAWRQEELLKARFSISSFGEDEAGDLYLTSMSTNSLHRLVAKR